MHGGKITRTMEHSEHVGVTNVIQGRGEELGRVRESNEVKLSIKTSSRSSGRIKAHAKH